jgi:CubicO group peptidase (beta-lactamase class C family)
LSSDLTSQSLREIDFSELDSQIAEELEKWKVPGVAVAILKDGKLIRANGYGFSDVKRNRSVTTETLFAIGSMTKSFTATSIAILADKGNLQWDTPVREYLPTLRLYDPVATERITPRDLLTHRSGLARHDLMWYKAAFTREELFHRLRFLEPSKDFRSTFQYQNLLYMVAGYLAGKLSGMTWEDFVRQEILTPAGMRQTNFKVTDAQKAEEFARPYMKLDNSVVEVPFCNMDAIGPAGSINSNIAELSRYLAFHVNAGSYEETTLVSERNALEMQTPQIVVPEADRYDELGDTSYGLGWFVSTYRGHKVVYHEGGIDGFLSLASFMPQKKIGAIVLTNLGATPLTTVLSFNILDRLLGLNRIDWSRRFQEAERVTETVKSEAKKRGYTLRKTNTKPAHEMEEYAGEYDHPGYGVVRVSYDGDTLNLTFNESSCPLEHFHYETFLTPDSPLDPLRATRVSFVTDVSGQVSALTIPLELTAKEIVFSRGAGHGKLDRSVLETYVGEYVLAGRTVTISITEDDTLVFLAPGQPQYELVPTGELSFKFKELSGFSMEFKTDVAGRIAEAAIYQPNGVFVAKRKEAG